MFHLIKEVTLMKSKINVIVGLVLALAITATAPVHAKGSAYTGQDLSVDKSAQLPPQIPINFAPKSNASGSDRVAGGNRYRVAGGHR